jgi:hypothetical protein
MALQYGQDAPAHVLEGWQRQAGRAAIALPYWDAVAALNTPTVIPDGWVPGFAGVVFIPDYPPKRHSLAQVAVLSSLRIPDPPARFGRTDSAATDEIRASVQS